MLYTDGLVEQRGMSIDQGLEALRLAAAQDPCHPDELCDRLVDAMLAIHPANDDIAVLALRALPTAPPPLHLELPSDPTELGQMRRDLGSWLREAGAAGEVVEVIQMACHEACSNSIEHGYSFGAGRLWVDAELDEGRVVLTVRDEGHWIERPDGPPRYRGNGLPLMAGADGLRRADARQRQRDGGADVAELGAGPGGGGGLTPLSRRRTTGIEGGPSGLTGVYRG